MRELLSSEACLQVFVASIYTYPGIQASVGHQLNAVLTLKTTTARQFLNTI